MEKFSKLLKASLKSEETEEWIDIYFTRPVGLVFALLWERLKVTPNMVSILSMFLGIASGYCFYFTDLWHNICGMLLLIFANLCDSTDGQLARLTNNKSLYGRMLDGIASGVWFLAIYMALCLRLSNQFMPFTNIHWGLWIWALAIISGFICHSSQSSLSDYYRQIHLYFLKGKSGSELDNYASQIKIRESLPKNAWLKRAYYTNYADYCRSQENRTPGFQRFFKLFMENPDERIRQKFLDGSRPLIKYTNVLSFNLRAIVLYITCLFNIPWVYFLVEIVVFGLLYVYMHKCHEELCYGLTHEMTDMKNDKEEV